MTYIPEQFAADVVMMLEQEGREWLARLPGVLAECEKQWQVTIGEPFPNLSFHYVAPATKADGTPVVVKAYLPTVEFEHETGALLHFAGRGAVRILERDTANQVALLERIMPGTPLTTMEDDERATVIAGQVMKALWRPAPPNSTFPTVEKWTKGLGRLREHYDSGYGPFPPVLVDRATALFTELLASAAEPVLLHGDLHHDNILDAGNSVWLAIDPKGITGEPAFETYALLHNPMPQLLERPEPGRVLARRVTILSEVLGIERERIRDWGFVMSVLSAWWGVEDFGEFSQGCRNVLTCAELLANNQL